MYTTSPVNLSSSLPLSVEQDPRIVTTGVTQLSPLPLETFNSRRKPWDANAILAGIVTIDYLSLTTWDHDAYAWAVRVLGEMTPPARRTDAQVMQYYGCQGDGFFFGDGFQDAKPHYMLRLSGSLAHMWLRDVLSRHKHDYLKHFKCTRIDVQYTRSDPFEANLPALKDFLRAAEWPSHRARRPVIDIIDKDKRTNQEQYGLSTLYIGSRKESVRMQRLYNKKVGDEILFRWETEYKQELSISLWEKLLEHGLDILDGILAGEMAIVPGEFAAEMAALVGSPPTRLRLVPRLSSELRTLAWLYRAAAPAALKLKASLTPGMRDAVLSFLEQVLSSEIVPPYVAPGRPVDDFLSLPM